MSEAAGQRLSQEEIERRLLALNSVGERAVFAGRCALRVLPYLIAETGELLFSQEREKHCKAIVAAIFYSFGSGLGVDYPYQLRIAILSYLVAYEAQTAAVVAHTNIARTAAEAAHAAVSTINKPNAAYIAYVTSYIPNTDDAVIDLEKLEQGAMPFI